MGSDSDSAKSGTDYKAVAGFDITITASKTSGTATFTLTPTDDTLVEGNETISVDGTSGTLTVNDTIVTINDDDSAPAVNLTASPSSLSEEAATTTVTVTAQFSNSSTYAADKTISVTVGDSNDSATSGTDYAAVDDFDITVKAGKTSGKATFTLTPTSDTIVEGNETISVDGTSGTLTVNDTSVTINDDDGAPAINLSTSPTNVSEGAGATTVTVTATFSNTNTYAADKTVSVTVGKSGDTATSGTDYAAVTAFDVTIKSGKTSGEATFDLTPTSDTLIEGNETLSVSGTNADLTVNGTSMTITDDDGAPAVNLSVNPSTVAEDASATTVTVTATFSNSSTYGAAKTVSVTVGKSGDGATSGTDYTAVTGFDVSIAAGKTSGTGTFTLTPTDDTLVEGNETLSVSGTNADLTVNGTTLALTDDDNPPAVNLSVNPSSVDEDASATTVTVTATFSNTSTYAAAQKVSVTVGKSGDSATSGTDYEAVTGFDVTIAAGKTSGTGTFTLTPTDDTVIEGDETITVSGTNADLTVNGTRMTLAEDDETEITLTASPSSVKEGDSATTVTVTAATDGDTFPADRTVTVKIGKVGDSATEGTDYATVADLTITITAGQTKGSKTFTLTPTDDNIIEGEESITVSGTSTGLTVNGTSVAIEDNENPTIILDIEPFLEADPDKLPEAAGATRVTVTAGTKGGVFDLDRQVYVTVGKDGDTAIFGDGKDYDTPSKSFHVMIKKNKTEGETTFTLTPNDDTLVEGDEVLTLVGSATVDWLDVTEATITIKDNDVPGMSLAASPSSVSEGAGATTVTVTASTGGVTFKTDRTVSVTVGKSGDSATSGTDYAAVTGFDVTITKGQTSGKQTFTLTPTDDTLVEGNESISVAGTTTGYTVTGTSVAITDNDTAPAVNLMASPSSVAESAGATTVTVTATFSNSNTYAADQTVTVSVGDSGSATSGTDYTAVADFDVTIAAGKGSGSATFILTPTQDTLVEGNETISVGGSATGLTVNGTSITLTDDDGAPAINLSVDPSSVAESAGDTTVTVTATFSNASTYEADKTVKVTVGKSGDTATSGTDYAAVTAFDITIAAQASSGSATFTLTPIDDTLVEGNETITLAGTNADLTVNGTSVTLTDDDDVPAVNLAVDRSVPEGAGPTAATLTATFSNPSTYETATTVTVTVGDGTDSATKGTDYAPVTSFTVVIAAGASSASTTFTLTPVDDTLIEGDEGLTVSGNSTRDLTVHDADVDVIDDDGAPEVVLSVQPTRVAEDAGATAVAVTATFSNTSTYETATTVTVSVGDAADSATSGTDYEAVTGFDVTIAAGASSGTATFTLTPIDDTLIEGNETITVDGTATVGDLAATGLAVQAASLTLVDDDTTPAIDLSVQPGRVAEDAGATRLTVTATFSNTNTYDTDTTVTVTVGDAADSATEGTDYQSVADFTVTIPAGVSSGSTPFILSPIDDTLIEGDESLTLDGTADNGLPVNGTHATLVDDDAVIDLSVNPARVAEDAGATSVTVTATFSPAVTFDADTTMTVSVGDSGTATSGTDYQAVSDFTVTIKAGRTSGSAPFTLTPIDDTLIEGDETISVDGTASGLTVNGTHATLVDDDAVINLSVDPARVAEMPAPLR